MALQTIRVDDIDGTTENVENVVFEYEGRQLEIDLSPANREKFEKALAPWAEAATRVGKTAGRSGARRTSGGRDLNAVRQWARENGYEVSDRGRVKGEILDAYDAAQ